MPKWILRPSECVLSLVLVLMSPAMAEEQRATQEMQDIVLVIDNSGSMKKNDPNFLVAKTLENFVRKASADTRMALLIFDQKARLVVPLTPVSTKNDNALLEGLDEIDYRGLFTNISDAVERAIYELKHDGRQGIPKAIVLLTDGIVDTGDPARDAEASRWLMQELAADAARYEIRVFAVALADQADFRLLQSLALATRGDYFRADRGEDIPGAFARINALFNASASANLPTGEEDSVPAEDAKAFLNMELMGDDTALAVETSEPLAIISDPVPLASASDPVAVGEGNLGTATSLSSPERSSAGTIVAMVLCASLLLMVLAIAAVRRQRMWKAPGFSEEKVAAESIMPTAFLEDIKGLTQKQWYEVTDEVTLVGRVAPDPAERVNAITINHGAISRRHALIKYKDHNYWIIDQQSRNGTFVNDRRIGEAVCLRHGDRVRFHGLEFKFTLAASAEADETLLATGPIRVPQPQNVGSGLRGISTITEAH